MCHVKRALGVGRLLQGGGRPNNPSRARTLCVSPHPGPPRIFHYSGLVFPKVLPSLCARYVLLMNNRPKVRSRGSKRYVFWVPLELRVLAVARASGVGQEATPAGRRSRGSKELWFFGPAGAASPRCRSCFRGRAGSNASRQEKHGPRRRIAACDNLARQARAACRGIRCHEPRPPRSRLQVRWRVQAEALPAGLVKRRQWFGVIQKLSASVSEVSRKSPPWENKNLDTA